jgi:Domain of unknown function (DUF4345)
MSKMILRLLLAVFGVIALITGGADTFGGIEGFSTLAGVPHEVDLTSDSGSMIENQVRFLGGIWLGVGFMILYATWNWGTSSTLIRFAGLAIFLGGIGRVMPWAVGGIVPEAMFPPIFLELVVFPALVFWDSRIRAAAES